MYSRNLNEQSQLGAYERRMALDPQEETINDILAFMGSKDSNVSIFFKYDWSTGKIEKIDTGMFLEYEYSHGLYEPKRGVCHEFLKEDKKTLGKLHVTSYGNHNVYKVNLDGYKDKAFIEDFIMEWFALYRYSRSAKL